MFLAYVRLAAKAIAGSAFRSLLTVSSIAIGSFSIVLMTSLAQSGLVTIAKGIEEIGGGRLMFVVSKKPEAMQAKRASYFRGLTPEDFAAVVTVPHVEGTTAFTSLRDKTLANERGNRCEADVVAGDARFLEVFHMPLVRGRTFSEEENNTHSKVCIVGAKVAEELWDGDAVGRTLTVAGKAHCLVIGQLSAKERLGIGFGFDWLRMVYMPLETAADEFAGLQQGRLLLVRTDAMSANPILKPLLERLLAARHNGVDDFEIFDLGNVMSKFYAVFFTLEVIVGLLAGIALLVGGVGVMNMMLVSVSERVREIGLRKALGASPRAIRSQFLAEAVVLSSLGGGLGIALGVGTTLGANAFIQHFQPNWSGVISLEAVLVSACVVMALGCGFGYMPARKAGQLSPVEALRT